MHEIEIKFYRNSRNAKKLQGIVEDFSHYELAPDLSNPCFIYINKDCYPEDMQLFTYFWDIVKKYKTSVISVDERMLSKDQAKDIIDWMNCYGNREYFPDQEDYCCISPGTKHLHGWGCKKLCSITRHGRFGRHNGLPWYKVGAFKSVEQCIDKQAIKDKLVEEAGTKGLQLCPMFSLEKALQYVDLLPDTINPEKDMEWVYDFQDDPVQGMHIVGVKPKYSPLESFSNTVNEFTTKLLKEDEGL